MKSKPTSRAVAILNRRHPPTPADLSLRANFRHQNDIAELIHQARASAGLTQRQLAQRIGTSPSVISRLESANYNAHSLVVLRRIATALQLQLQLRFVARPPAPTPPLTPPPAPRDRTPHPHSLLSLSNTFFATLYRLSTEGGHKLIFSGPLP